MKFGSSPVKEPILTKCRKCGVMHGMGVLDTTTQVHTPIDVCYDCLWKNNMCYSPPDPVEINTENAEKVMREAQDRLVRDMMISSGVPPFTDLTSNQPTQ